MAATNFQLGDGIGSRVELADGHRMPVLGLGVWRSPPGDPTRGAVSHAFRAGYRLIDTATLYRNEADVGRAIAESELPREQVFVTTKLWNDDQGFEPAVRACARSLKLLQLEYIDLYLIHWPVSERRLESWRALERLQKDGFCRSIGVSNFTVEHLEELRAHSEVVPAVNQVEFSPFLYQRELLEYCRARGIQLEAYAPLTRGRRLDDPVVGAIAEAHKARPSQVLLRWGLQHGVIVIPKSIRPERIDENSRLFGFELSRAEMDRLDHLDEGYRNVTDPSTFR